MNANGHFVAVEGVTKRFGELEVLKRVSLDVDEHGVVCLIGASGSGKSTLLRCINLLERVDEGTIVVDGQAITIPLARFTDWLVARDRRRRQAGGPTA